VVSADKFFRDLRESYGRIRDYEATVTIRLAGTTSVGRLSYKEPGLLNFRFGVPAGQLINFDGRKLDVVDPVNKAYLEQEYSSTSTSELAGAASGQGLSMLQSNYSVAYLAGPEEVPLEPGSTEAVIKLRFVSRATTSFSELIVSIEDSLIRRIEAKLQSGGPMVMDFEGIKLNKGIPSSRFTFAPPADYALVENWLFDSDR
jgi:outer membrane lipoprotein-sorting protein